jgi:hypothetical protein
VWHLLSRCLVRHLEVEREDHRDADLEALMTDARLTVHHSRGCLHEFCTRCRMQGAA